jgi:predicted metal-dependent phosphoesterase TrpH
MPVLFVFVLFSLPLGAQEARWYKGNTHTHTTNSDGNEVPRRVVRWYLDHEYNFLVITDHNMITDITYLDTDRNDDFILIPGEEVTDSYGGKPAHVNAIGLKGTVTPLHGESMVQTLQNDVDAIHAAGGIAQINHPNFRYAFGEKELAGLKNVNLVEILNIAKDCHNYAAGGFPSVETMWDSLLSKGQLWFGVISDDTHDYVGEFSADKSYPGKGWIMVRASSLSQESILSSIAKGDFYATNGITINDVSITKSAYSVEIVPWGQAKYTTTFIGRHGRVLKESYETNATYTIRGDEGYVRARIFCSTGDVAYTQPVMIR